MQQYKVCHITSVHTRYDIRIFVKECISLIKNNFSVSLIVADSKGNESNNGVSIFDVGKTSGRFSRIFYTTKQIYRKVLELNPDIVHFHDPELMLVGVKLSKLGYKVIYDVHEDLPKQVMSKSWIPNYIRPIISKIVTYIEKLCSSKFTGIIAATSIIANRFNKYNNNVRVIHNYPLLSEMANTNTNWDKRDSSLCYIGSISKTRGIEPLIMSLEMSKLKLELAGIFSDDLSITRLSKLPGYQYVNYNGILNRQEVAELLSKVKVGIVTLLPTLSYVESLPIKLFEYMLAGIPVIASDFKLWREIIMSHKCGILVNPKDSNEVASACELLLNDQSLAKQMGENGRRAVLEHYNWEVECVYLVDFYNKIYE
ncbi:MAG: glycosyltransferase family 4 protein [Neisseriaceae bacterium]